MYRRTVIVTVAIALVALVALAVLAQSVLGMAGWWAVLGIGLLTSGAFQITINGNPAFFAIGCGALWRPADRLLHRRTLFATRGPPT